MFVVFAYVGGTYFFLSNVFNFAVQCVKEVVSWFVLLMRRKTGRHIGRLYSRALSVSIAKKPGGNESNGGVIEYVDEEEEITDGTVGTEEKKTLLKWEDQSDEETTINN